MESGNKYELKRINFIEKVTELFQFLCDDYGYIGPEHCYTEQENGTITSDSMAYSNHSIDRKIVFYNAYHPVDYGFELQFYKPSISTSFSDGLMVHYVLKEKQDIEQSYLVDAVELLKNDFLDILVGRKWTNNS